MEKYRAKIMLINYHFETKTFISFSGKTYLPFSKANLSVIVTILFLDVFQIITNL
jgi:hypothetical protein